MRIDAEYTVTVKASDGNADNTDTEEITIIVTNVDEKGTATFDHEPRENTPNLTASLVDPDDSVSDLEVWQWARASSRNGRFIDIQDATTASYTPGQDDTGKYLRATATYTDAQGGGKSAYVTSQNRTLWKPSGAPQFRGPDSEDLGATSYKGSKRECESGDQRRRPGCSYGHWG